MHLRAALRALLKHPLVSLVAVLSLALGIGANTALFSVVEGILLRPLPVSRPGDLVNLEPEQVPRQARQISCSNAGSCDIVFSYPMLRDLEAANIAPLSGIAGHRGFGVNVSLEGETVAGRGHYVSGGYFPTLGLTPALGRLLGPSDDLVEGAHPVAVLSYDFWASRTGQDPSIVGRTVHVNGQALEVVGVAPEGFHGTTLGERPEVFVPISMRNVLESGSADVDERRSYWIYVFGRLAPGATREEAEGALNGVYRNIVTDVEAPLREGMSDEDMARFRAGEILLTDGRRGQSNFDEDARNPLLLLFTVTGMVLLIACANVANLLLARSVSRTDEMALRGSLGARRRDLLAQLVGEALLLAGISAVAGILLGVWMSGLLQRVAPPDLGWALDFQMDPRILVFTVAVATITGLVFGIYPAVFGSRTDLAGLIRASSGQPSGGRGAARFRASVVTVQLALCLVLLVSAGLFTQSLRNVARVDLGVRTENLITFGISPGRSGYADDEIPILYDRAEQALGAIPAVTSVSSSVIPILAGGEIMSTMRIEGYEPPPGESSGIFLNVVGPDYFRTLSIPLVAGREFEAADDEDAPEVAIVNESFARTYGLGEGASALGKRLGRSEDGDLDIAIVGVVADMIYSDPKSPREPMFFLPYRQSNNSWGSLSFYVRTAADPGPVMAQVRSTVQGLDSDLPLESFRTMEQQVGENVATDRLMTMLLAVFAALAAILAAVGLYGVLAFAVAQRTRELGLRMALGAGSARIRTTVLGGVTRIFLVGGVIGAVGAVLLGRTAESMLFEVRGTDPGIILIAIAALGLVAIAAAYVPARQASRIEPMDALRYE
jgi:predicted permease